MKTLVTLVVGFLLGMFSMYVWQSQTVATDAPLSQATSNPPAAPTDIATNVSTPATNSAGENIDQTVTSTASATVEPPGNVEAMAKATANASKETPKVQYGSATLDEMMAMNQARNPDWQKPYWSLPRDESDARVAEDKLQYRLFSNEVAQAHPAKSISCRAELCRLEFTFPDVQAMEAFNRRWDGSVLNGSHSIWSSGFADASGNASFIIYAVRNETFP